MVALLFLELFVRRGRLFPPARQLLRPSLNANGIAFQHGDRLCGSSQLPQLRPVPKPYTLTP